jgi:hypothetical protein
MRDDINKKQVKKGPKISVLTGITKEIGNPQLIRKGKEMNDIKSCSCIFLKSDCRNRDCVYFFILISISDIFLKVFM